MLPIFNPDWIPDQQWIDDNKQSGPFDNNAISNQEEEEDFNIDAYEEFKKWL